MNPSNQPPETNTPAQCSLPQQRHAPLSRKTRTNFIEAENLTLENLKRLHPEWVDANGDSPACTSLEYAMSDTTRYESSLVALSETQPITIKSGTPNG